jgi:creatinine amidohydrolase
LGELTWPEAQSRGELGSVLLVPLGSTEQHGPHLPLITDTDIAIELARRALSHLPGALIAPAMPYGASGEHDDFAGTLSIGRQALHLVVIELVRSALATFDRVVLVSTHGGNLEPVRSACELLAEEGRDALLWSPAWKGDAHAGRIETSVMLAIDPSRIQLERAVAGNTAPIDRLMAELVRNGVRHASPGGVLGDPTGASAAEGEQLLDSAARELVRRVRDWEAVRR